MLSSFKRQKILIGMFVGFLLILIFILAIYLVVIKEDEENIIETATQEVFNPSKEDPFSQPDEFSVAQAQLNEGNAEGSLATSLEIAKNTSNATESRVRAYNQCIISAVSIGDTVVAEDCKREGEILADQLQPDQAVSDWKIILNNSLTGNDDPLANVEDETED